MPVTTYTAGNAQWLGIAKETTRGTAAAAPTAFVPLISPKFVEHIAPLEDAGLRGSLTKTFGHQQGMKYPELSYQTYPYMDSLYQHVLAALGVADQVAGTANGTATTLSAGTTAGATTVTTAASVAASTVVQVDTGAGAEIRTVTAVTGAAAPYTLTLNSALTNAHASGATVQPVNADPITHKTSLLNAGPPPSYTLWYFDGIECWQIVGAQSSNLKIDAKVGALGQVDAGWMGLTAATVTSPSNVPASNPPMPSWTSTISVGGTGFATLTEVGLTIKRATEAMPVLNGSQTPGAIFVGELEVTGDLNGVFQGSTDTNWANFLANTQPALVVSIAPAGDATHKLTLQMTKVAYTDSSFSGSNKWMEIQSKVEALGNSTDALDANLSPIQAQFITTVSTAY